jgi:hypothetical protein
MTKITSPNILNLAEKLEIKSNILIEKATLTEEINNIQIEKINEVPQNKFIADFINSCPSKTPFEINYADSILTIKYKV